MYSTGKVRSSVDESTQSVAAGASAELGIRRTCRDCLNGLEGIVFDLVFESCSADDWASWLKTPMEKAATWGDCALMKRLLEAGAPVGSTLLRAIERGQTHMVDFIVTGRAGASQNFSRAEGDGNYPIHVAAKLGHESIVRLLLLEGDQKDVQGRKGRTPLHLAAQHGHLGAVEALLEAGASVNIQDIYGETVLFAAARYGHADVVRAVIRHGADVNKCEEDAMGITALHMVANMGDTDGRVTEALLKAGADVNARSERGIAPLHFAVRRGSLEVTHALLRSGADVNARDREGRVPLHYAAVSAGREGTAECVDLLLRWGGDETAQTEGDLETPKDVIARGVQSSNSQIGDLHRVHRLLTNAPADRAWRRRSPLVICRARLERHRLLASATRNSSNHSKVDKTNNDSPGSRLRDVQDGVEGYLAMAIFRVDNEDLFRKIVSFL